MIIVASVALLSARLGSGWKTSPDFPDLADELAAGAEFDHPLFPLLWPRD
jgi:hypothetical protein